METFGSRLRKLRKEAKLTQKELGRLVGVSGPMVTQWEADSSRPKKEPADKICALLNTSWEYLSDGAMPPHEYGAASSSAPMSVMEDRPAFIARRPVDIRHVTKSSIEDILSGNKSAGISAGVKALGIIESVGAGKRTFSFTETSEGMSPRIEPGDTVYIDPDQTNCSPGRGVWLFKIGSGYELGTVTETPRGLMLRFDNQAPGWEPMQVQPSDCAGKLVAFVPSWLN